MELRNKFDMIKLSSHFLSFFYSLSPFENKTHIKWYLYVHVIKINNYF